MSPTRFHRPQSTGKSSFGVTMPASVNGWCDVTDLVVKRFGVPPPGTVLEASGDRLVIAAGENALMPASVQPSGKRLMPIAEFLRGYHVQPGERFGAETR